MKSTSDDGEVNLRRQTNSMKSKERTAANNNTMSADTKDFIQKLCYRKTASIDMTQYGFINDSKVDPVKFMIKPLREQLEKICVKSTSVKQRKTTPSPSRTKAHEVINPAERKPKTCTPKSVKSTSVKQRKTTPSPSRTKAHEVINPAERKPKTCTPKSAMSYPGTHSSRTRPRKVRIQSDSSPSPVPAIKEKKVRLKSPRRSKGEKVDSKNDVRPRKNNLMK